MSGNAPLINDIVYFSLMITAHCCRRSTACSHWCALSSKLVDVRRHQLPEGRWGDRGVESRPWAWEARYSRSGTKISIYWWGKWWMLIKNLSPGFHLMSGLKMSSSGGQTAVSFYRVMQHFSCPGDLPSMAAISSIALQFLDLDLQYKHKGRYKARDQ